MSKEKEFFEFISALHKNNVLKHFVLIGSWALKVYQENYSFKTFELVTKDIDLLVKSPRGPFPKETESIYKILQEKGYKVQPALLSKVEKYIPDKSISDNDLDIEFICQPGRYIKDAYQIKELGIAAQPLQYQYVLLKNIVTLRYKGINIDVPDPMVWSIHKIAISRLRTGKNRKIKMINDLKVAGIIINELGEDRILKKADQFKGKFLKLFKKGCEEYISYQLVINE